MSDKIQKTNVCRLLDAAGIAYELITYAVDENDLSAVHVADELGEDIDAVFKTIVLEGDKVKHFVCVVPGAFEVDLKKAARASGNKSCKPIPQKELLPLTGYIRGGCCPIGMKKQLPTYIDETCLLCEKIYISAGQRGMQLRLSPQDLIGYVPATTADLI
ncbi:MAG: Cys-tRNA(Pro) deacylase [Paludibacteraceae bacterium]|nr:Cys-tRNA(Pro) deacylase [Paludibacteraceae bacterium]